MPALLLRAWNIIVSPDSEWAAIELERKPAHRILFGYLAPLAMVGPIASACGMLIRGNGPIAEGGAPLQFALLSAFGGFIAALLGVVIIASVVYLVTPFYRAPRDFRAVFRLVAYAGTPIWLAAVVLVVPLKDFPLLIVALLVALMHALYVFYLGLHRVVKIPLEEAAECAAIVALASLFFSTVVGYLGGALGLFPQM